MKIFVLHDPRRPTIESDRLIAELDRQGLQEEDYEMQYSILPNSFEGAPTTTEQSINWSHKNLVQLAKLFGHLEVCILESDVMFPHPEGWKYFLENKPDHFDLYLGGVYSLNQGAQDRLEPGACDIHNFAGMHCYIIHSRFYEKFLSVPDDMHIDLALAGYGVYKVCYPFSAIQRQGWSANAKAEVNYNYNLIKSQRVYGWEHYHDENFP